MSGSESESTAATSDPPNELPLSLTSEVSSCLATFTNWEYRFRLIITNESDRAFPGPCRELLIEPLLEKSVDGDSVAATNYIDTPASGHVHVERLEPDESTIETFPIILPNEGNYTLTATCNEVLVVDSDGDVEYNQDHTTSEGKNKRNCSTVDWWVKYRNTGKQANAPAYEFYCRSKRKALITAGGIASILAVLLAYFQFFAGG